MRNTTTIMVVAVVFIGSKKSLENARNCRTTNRVLVVHIFYISE